MLISYDFYKAVNVSVKNLKPPVTKSLEFYLYNILMTPVIVQQPVALLLSQSLDSHYNEKITILKTMGEHILTVVGIFPASMKAISPDYYKNMGQIAYSRLSRATYQQKHVSEIYEETADRFQDCTIVLRKAVQALAEPRLNVVGFKEDKEAVLEE